MLVMTYGARLRDTEAQIVNVQHCLKKSIIVTVYYDAIHLVLMSL